MSIFSTDIKSFFNPSQTYYEKLSLDVKDYGDQELQKKQSEIEGRTVGSPDTGSSKTLYIMLGLAVAALVTLVILKKKKII